MLNAPLALPVEDLLFLQDGPLRAPVLKAALIGMVSTPARFGIASGSPILSYAPSPSSALYDGIRRIRRIKS